jgi:hypothetical protein
LSKLANNSAFHIDGVAMGLLKQLLLFSGRGHDSIGCMNLPAANGWMRRTFEDDIANGKIGIQASSKAGKKDSATIGFQGFEAFGSNANDLHILCSIAKLSRNGFGFNGEGDEDEPMAAEGWFHGPGIVTKQLAVMLYLLCQCLFLRCGRLPVMC